MSDAPALIAYDGSEASRHAIAGRATLAGRRTLIVVARSSMESVAARIEGHDVVAHEPDDPAERSAAEGVRLAPAAGLDADGWWSRGTARWARRSPTPPSASAPP